MIQTVTEQDFIRAFDDMNRSENFTRPARRALFEYLEDLADDVGEQYELDVIALCCEWGEYTADELRDEYPGHFDADEDAMIENFMAETHIIPVEHYGGENTYLVLAF